MSATNSHKRVSVTQSNHLVEASYRLDLVEKRVVLCLLAKVDPRKPVPKVLRLDVNEYADMTGGDPKTAYRDLKSGALGLVGQVIRTSDLSHQSGRHQNWMDYVDYFDGEGRIEASFSPSIKPYISLLAKRFTTIGIEHVAKFRSFYAIRMFELLMQFQSTGERRIALDDLRDILRIGQEQYPKFNDLRKRVIDPSIQEINEKSDYTVEWTKTKAGRRVIGIHFNFCRDNQLSLPL
jgi:plasmid replication initiation protein